MQNLFWYICLAGIGVGSTAYAVFMKKDIYKPSTLLVFYLFLAGLTWVGEFIVLGLFNSYAYKTGLFEDPWAQNLLGHLLLNTTLYPAAAVVMVAYSFKYGWFFFISALFTLFEYLFVKYKLYEQHWWRYYMTIIAVLIFMSIAIKWFPKIKQGCSGLTRAVTFFFIALVIVHIPAPLLLLAGEQYYRMDFVNNLFNNLYISSIIIIFSYHLIECLLLIIFTCVLKKWYWSLVPFIISITVQNIFAKMNILVIKDHWHLIYTLIIYEVFIAIFVLIEKHTLKPTSA